MIPNSVPPRPRDGDEGADDRHEAAEERQHRDGKGERDAEDPDPEADEHRVHQCHRGLRPDVLTQGGPHPAGDSSTWRPVDSPIHLCSQGRNLGPSLRKENASTNASTSVTTALPITPRLLST
jgi:hypothetical protein